MKRLVSSCYELFFQSPQQSLTQQVIAIGIIAMIVLMALVLLV